MYRIRPLSEKADVTAEHLNICDLSENIGNHGYRFSIEHVIGESMTFRKATKKTDLWMLRIWFTGRSIRLGFPQSSFRVEKEIVKSVKLLMDTFLRLRKTTSVTRPRKAWNVHRVMYPFCPPFVLYITYYCVSNDIVYSTVRSWAYELVLLKYNVCIADLSRLIFISDSAICIVEVSDAWLHMDIHTRARAYKYR